MEIKKYAAGAAYFFEGRGLTAPFLVFEEFFAVFECVGRFFHDAIEFFVSAFVERGCGACSHGADDDGLLFIVIGLLVLSGAFEVIGGGDEFFYVEPGFGGQVFLEDPEIAGVRFLDRVEDGSGATVVGSEDEQPVAEHFVKVFQVAGGGDGAFAVVFAFIRFVIDFETEDAAGGGHKLPGSFGADA